MQTFSFGRHQSFRNASCEFELGKTHKNHLSFIWEATIGAKVIIILLMACKPYYDRFQAQWDIYSMWRRREHLAISKTNNIFNSIPFNSIRLDSIRFGLVSYLLV